MTDMFREALRRMLERRGRRPQPREVRDLGPATVAFPLVGAVLVGDVLVCVSRNLEPTRVALYDVAARTVRDEVQIPNGLGAWAIEPDGAGGVYLGQFGAQSGHNLYRLDLASRRLEPLAALPHVYIWDLARAPDGVLYGVLTSPAGAFRWDPGTGAVTMLPSAAAGEGDVPRSIAAVGADMVIGGSAQRRAMLRAVDHATGDVRDVLPAELSDDGIVYTLAAEGDLLAVGTRGPGERDPAVALLDTGDAGDTGDLTLRHVARLAGESVVDAMAISDDAVVATARPSGALYRVDRRTGDVQRLAQPVPLDEQRAVVLAGREVVGASASGAVWHLDPASAAVDVVDLVNDGLLEGGAERVQSLAARGDRVWAGGTFSFSERDLRSGALTRRRVPGEPKDMVAVGGQLYLVIYPVAQLWRLDADGEVELAAQLPVEQNRPLAVHHEPERDWILVGSAADRAGGGALHVHERATGALRTYRNPIDAAQRVMALATLDGLAYLGGTGEGSIVAWDLDAGREAWRLPPIPGAGSVRGLAVADGHMAAFTTEGWFAVIDPATRAFVHRRKATPAGGGLVAAGRHLYGVDTDHLYRFTTTTYAVATVLDDLGAVLWGHPFLAADEQDRLYVLRGTDVLQVVP